MTKFCSRLLACMLCLWGSTVSLAQVELNVKLKPASNELQTLWQSPQKQSPSLSLTQQFPFLSQLGAIRPLSVNGLPKNAQGVEVERLYTLSFPQVQDVALIQNQLLQTGQFQFVEENRTLQLDKLNTWEYKPDDDSLSKQWYHSYIESFKAWDLTRGNPNVRVGVLDTGLDYDHPEFEGQLWINGPEDLNNNGKLDPWPFSETRDGVQGDFDGVDGDGNGFIDDVIGYDFTDQPRNPLFGDNLNQDPDPLDDNEHGTIVAGVISARSDNQIGGAGLAPACKLTVIRAFGSTGAGEDDDVARAIIYAADNGIQILNMSFGDIYPSLMMQEAIKYAYAKGVVMISSAGNASGDQLHYPSGFEEVISVSASTADLETGREYLWPLSSYGLTVDLAAPGAGIFTPTVRDTLAGGSIKMYDSPSGTSMAAPMVSAAAALIFAYKGVKTPDQIRGILTSSTDDISDPGWDHFTGAGRLNMYKALELIGNSRVQLISPVHDGGSAADSVWIIGTVLDPQMTDYELEWQTGTEGENQWESLPLLKNPSYQQIEDTLGLWDLRNLPEGEYTLRLKVNKSNGFTAEDRIRFIRDTTPPEVEIKRAVSSWEDESRRMFIVFRSSDQGVHTLHYRRVGTSIYKQETFDRTTLNGEFLLKPSVLPNGDYEFFIRTVNMAGLSGDSEIQTFTFQAQNIVRTGYKRKSYTLPMGRFLERAYDLDQDGLKEVIYSEYTDGLAFGKLKFAEFNGVRFVEIDSLSFKPILIPKDVGDTDQDGLLELFCSVNDSSFLIEQAASNLIPSELIWRNEDQGLYASQLADTDMDGTLEMILRDGFDFFVYEKNGDDFTEAAKLINITQDSAGPGLTKSVVGDFDQDGKPSIVFGDNDADFLVYEHNNANAYKNILTDTTDLAEANAEVFMTQGDFDGDGAEEFFIAVHTSTLENEDEEYDPQFWWLRIFKATSNNSLEVIWEDYVYDIISKTYNATSAGNLDDDPADEIVFTTFPKTYVINQKGSSFGMDWFHEGTLATHHVIGDFDGNGIQEVGIGRGDTTLFWEKDILNTGPAPVIALRGKVLGFDKVELSWDASSNATAYQVWRVPDYPVNNQATVFSPVNGTEFVDFDLATDTFHLYVLRAMNATDTSGFGGAVLLRPHPRPRIDSVKAVSSNQLEVFFTEPVVDRQEDKARFLLNGQVPASTIIQSGTRGKRLIVSFAEVFQQGANELKVDTSFMDADFANLDPSSTTHSFWYEIIEEDKLILSDWKSTGDKTAILQFNFPLDETLALDSSNYSIDPYGYIESVAWASNDMDAVEITIGDARFGALGYPISITVDSVCALNLVCIGDEGNTATFSAHKQDLTEVFVYPNPVRKHELFNGVRFANLTQQATIEIYTVSGRFVNKLEENDGDGGFEWNLRDQGDRRIKPGIYLYRVYTEELGIEEFVGKFSVVE